MQQTACGSTLIPDPCFFVHVKTWLYPTSTQVTRIITSSLRADLHSMKTRGCQLVCVEEKSPHALLLPWPSSSALVRRCKPFHSKGPLCSVQVYIPVPSRRRFGASSLCQTHWLDSRSICVTWISVSTYPSALPHLGLPNHSSACGSVTVPGKAAGFPLPICKRKL